METYTLNPTNVELLNFFPVLSGKTRDGILDLKTLAKKFPLDVEEHISNEGLVIMQGENVVKKSYDIGSKNQSVDYIPNGFTKLVLPINSELAEYSKPRIIIPVGCWCSSCYEVGPLGHKNTCPGPVKQNLRLTLAGLISCKSRVKKITNETLITAVDSYFEKVEKLENILDNVYVQATREIEPRFQNILFNFNSSPSETEIFTNITYRAIYNIYGTEKFFQGAISLQYINEEDKKVSIRISEKNITLVSCPWKEKNLYKQVVSRIQDSGQDYTVDSAIVKSAMGKFRLYPSESNQKVILKTVYDYFNPTDINGNPLLHKGPKKTIWEEKKTSSGVIQIPFEYIVTPEMENILFKYTIKPPKGGKIIIKLTKCIQREDQLTIDPYEISAQINTSGIVTMIFSYVNPDEADSAKDIDKQLETAKLYFETIRNLMEIHFKEMLENSEVFEHIEIEESKHIWNTVPGTMTYAKYKRPFYPGYIVEKYDNGWTGNYGYVVTSNKGEYGVIFNSEPFDSKIVHKTRIMRGESVPVKFKVSYKDSAQKNTQLPEVMLPNEESAFVLESYKEGKNVYRVIQGTPETYYLNNLRLYKKSFRDEPFKSGSQTCGKSEDGVPIRPVPYSFYGNCPGGKSQYVNKIGVRSRGEDHLYYPCCVNITKGKELETQEYFVNFLLDGMSDEEFKEGNIEVDIINGAPIDDKFAGTFVPGTTDIGNNVTFWNKETDEWSEGEIIKRKKTSGRGNDNYVEITVDGNDGNTYIITGNDLHPMHRESRNFKGLRNLTKENGEKYTEDEQKELLINCAKKLNLVKPEIALEKEGFDTQSEVLKKLKELTGHNNIQEIITGTNPFVNIHINGLEKRAYEVAFIPENAIRSLLYISSQDKQYLIDTENKIMRVDIDASDYYETLLDGFITQDRVYYPFDLLYSKKERVKENYIEGDSGRLFDLQEITGAISSTKTTISILVKNPLGLRIGSSAYIGPTDPAVSLLSFVKETRKPSDIILFIPQVGNSKYMIWKNKSTDDKIVVQLLSSDRKKTWWLGLRNPKSGDPTRLLPYLLETSIDFKKGDFVQLRLNIMSNGDINTHTPYVDVQKVPKEMSKPYEETRIHIFTILKAENSDVFDDVISWDFYVYRKSYYPRENSRQALKSIV